MPLFSSSNFAVSDAEKYPDLYRLVSVVSSSPRSELKELLPEVSRFLRSGFFTKLLREELSSLSADPDYNRFAFETTIDVIRFPQFVVQLGRLPRLTPNEAAGSEVSAYAVDIMYHNLGPQAVPFDLYRVPDHQLNEVFDRESRPQYVRTSVLLPGECIFLNAGMDIFRVQPTDRDVFQVAVVSTKEQSLEWHYDYDTLAPLYTSAGRNSSSTIQHAIAILVQMGCVEAAPSIAAAYEAEDHFVRWSAVKAVLALSPNLGMELLERAKCDAHPHVRTAAMKTSAIFQMQSSWQQ